MKHAPKLPLGFLGLGTLLFVLDLIVKSVYILVVQRKALFGSQLQVSSIRFLGCDHSADGRF
jgi:hypothetical protein